jgi:predicted DNA-binding transcriptional regulator YafY
VRADRLVATLLLLQRRQRVTAAEVAAELEISERTARRDLEALSAAGIPVYSQQGRGGGWALVGGARTDLSDLTATEARALFLVAGPSASATPELKAALRKLVHALPEPFRVDAESAASSVMVDPDGWGRTRRMDRPRYLEVLQAATITGRQVRLGYAGRDGTATTRIVHPLGLVVKAMVWYLIAGTDKGLRTFRVDRVSDVERTDDPVVRPADFDLEAAWENIRVAVDELRSPVRVEGVAEPEIVPVLQWMFDRQIDLGPTSGDGRIPVTIGGHSVEIIAAQLAGFGARVEVTAPPVARARLAAIGEELRRTYGPPGEGGVTDGRRPTPTGPGLLPTR